METSLASVRLLVVGLNHKTAPLQVRETLAFNGDALRSALALFRQRHPAAEAVLLSTCNRVELYIARPLSGEPTFHTLVQFLAEARGLKSADLHGHLYHHEDRAAVEHLFAVASSLDSMVLGETQILAQVKQAYQTAVEAGCVGAGGEGGGDTRVFHTLFQRSIAAAKDVHDSTELSSGRLSIASVAVDLARSVFERFDDKTVLCVGAGEMANLMLTHLRGLNPKKLVITNRSLPRAEALAQEFHGQAAPFTALEELLVEADIVLTSTGATEAVITEAMFRGLLKPRKYRPIVMIDIAVPRDVAAAVGALSNVYLYNIDDLQEVADSNRGKRDAQIEQSTAIVTRHVEDFLQWFAARDVGPIVKALYAHANQVAQAEVEALLAKHPEWSPEHRAAVEKLTHRVVSKLLHTPVTQITQQAETTARPMLAAALRKLFGLNP